MTVSLEKTINAVYQELLGARSALNTKIEKTEET